MTKICLKSQLSEEYPLKVELADGTTLAVYLVGDDVFVTEDRCSHGEASLSEGFVEGYDIVCPFHLGRFDVRTGEATKEPCYLPIKTFATKVEGDQIHLNEAL